MAFTLEHQTKELLENSIIDTEFLIDEELKTLAFYDHNSEKKEFYIRYYGNGNRIYFKKRDI